MKIQSNPESVKKLHPLTSLRFLAAVMIYVHHVADHFGLPRDFGHTFAWGNGVSFFFVLSGFILTYVYSSRHAFDGRIFLLTRLARLWPAHIAAFLLLCLFSPISVSTDFSYARLLAYLTLTQSWIPILKYNFSFVGPSWSISTEAGLYICFLLLFKNWTRTWIHKLLGSLVVILLIIYAVNTGPALFQQSKADSLISLIYIWPLSRVFEFALGMAAAHLWFRFQASEKLGFVLAGVLELVAFLMVIWILQNIQEWTQRVSGLTWVGAAGGRWLAQGGFACMAFAGLIFVMALGKGFISKALAQKVPVLLGEISYSFYLVHQTLIFAWEKNTRALIHIPTGLQIAWLFSITVVLAYLIWAAIETPCRKMVAARLHGKRSNSMADKVRSDVHPLRFTDGLFKGSGKWVWAGVAALGLLLLPIVYLVEWKSSIQMVDESTTEKLLEKIPDEMRDVEFGDEFMLRGAFWKSFPDHLELNLVWKSLAPQKLLWLVPVHIVDETGRTLTQADYLQDTSKSNVQIGDTWLDVVKLPLGSLKGAKAVAIGLMDPKNTGHWLLAGKGERDWNNDRLWIPLPSNFNPKQTSPPSSGTSLKGFLDLVNQGVVTGWIWDPRNIGQRQVVSVFDDNAWIGDAEANQWRADLQEAHVGDGKYCFRLKTPASLLDGKTHLLHVFVKGTQIELKGSPKQVTLVPAK